jgi:hypothetical protein
MFVSLMTFTALHTTNSLLDLNITFIVSSKLVSDIKGGT